MQRPDHPCRAGTHRRGPVAAQGLDQVQTHTQSLTPTPEASVDGQRLSNRRASETKLHLPPALFPPDYIPNEN